MKPALARVLNSLRRECGLSQKKAADDLGISQALLSHYENGVREPKLEFIQKACEYYGVSSDYLLGRTDKKRSVLDILPSEILEAQRCVGAGALILALLSEIGDKQISSAVSKYLSYSFYFVLAALRMPAKPYEPLFDAAMKTAESGLVMTLLGVQEETDALSTLSDETLKEKYPDQYQTLLELKSTIEKDVQKISSLNKANGY